MNAEPLSASAAHADRRTRRSDDTMMALHYQLAFVRSEADLDALVLADASGCLVAGAGAWPTCEMLAAYAPLWLDERTSTGGPGMDPLDRIDRAILPSDPSVEVRRLWVDGMEVLLCSRGGSGEMRTAGLERAAAGCRRILRASA